MVSYEIPQGKNVAQAFYYPGTGWIFLRRRAPDAELWSRRESKNVWNDIEMIWNDEGV